MASAESLESTFVSRSVPNAAPGNAQTLGKPAGRPWPEHLADQAPVLIWALSADGKCEYANRGWLEFVGCDANDELGDGWKCHLHPDDLEATSEALREAYVRQASFEIEYRLRRHDGAYRWVLAAGVPHYDNDERLLGYVGSCVDITDHKRVQLELQNLLADSEKAQAILAAQTQRLHELAESDPLTSVLNRRSFRERFEREWGRAARHGRPLACIMLDIDFFKKVNDTYGHSTGDAILRRVAEVLVERCRPSDLVARYGGEEFCIMVPETDETGAANLADRLRVALAAEPVCGGDKPLYITASFGVAQRNAETQSVDELIEQADQALHIAKHSGRNRVIQFASESAFADMMTHDSPSQLLAQVTAGQLATPSPVVQCEETVGHVAELFLRHGIGSAPVVDDLGKLVGFISERDLMLLDVSREEWSRPVREIMKTNVVCYEENTPGSQIFQFLCRVSIHRIVIVKNGRPLGVISPSSLLKYFQGRAAG